MLLRYGPALAGLFFGLILTGGLISEQLSGVRVDPSPPATNSRRAIGRQERLSPSGQHYFRAFLEIFTPIVLQRENKGRQATYRPAAGNYRWGDKNRDCAGLVRYLFWEAMQPHDRVFLAHYAELSGLIPAQDTSELLRISRGWGSMNFTAGELKARSYFLGRSPRPEQLKTGDLLFFESAELSIRHTMLVIHSGPSVYLVYHTGDGRNELRIRTLADLNGLSGTEWHVEAANPVFQGFFRPQFLD